MNTSSHHLDYDEITQVLIVGGGIVGLSTSLFLSWRGISSLLVERHPGTAIHPRIPGLAQPTMEMFRSVGKMSTPSSSVTAARRWAARLLRMCWSRYCERGPNSSVEICASGPNWWHSSRMKMASRPQSASGKAPAHARFAPSFWWLLTAAIAGSASSLA